MTDVIFARPRHDYQSYSDFWQLATLSGYPVIFIDEIDPYDAAKTYIFSSPDAESGWPFTFPNAKARIVFWLLEWYADYVKQPGVDEVWNSNKTFAQMVGAKFVPMGSHPGLMLNEAHHEKIYDVAHLSCVTPRRGRLLNSLVADGIRVAPNGWGDERDRLLKQSHAMLHIHQHDNIPAVAPLRTAIAAAYSLPLITEGGWSVAPLERCAYVMEYDEMAKNINILVKMPDMLNAVQLLGEFIHKWLCHSLTFRHCVEAAL